MKQLKHLLIIALIFTSIAAIAQNETPKGFTAGSIVLNDGTSLNGLLKDNLRKEAAIFFISEAGGKKKKYQGTDITGAELDGATYLCIKADFFKVVCKGNLCFLQKVSDASGIPVYNGTEAIYCNGTEGKPGDYFLYSATDKQLKMISRNTIETVAANSFSGCTAAIEKAKTVKNDLAQMKDAVDIYNQWNK
ncbi:MAG: hypothetical protein ABIS01_10855 [Ferruginibacter sp.]